MGRRGTNEQKTPAILAVFDLLVPTVCFDSIISALRVILIPAELLFHLGLCGPSHRVHCAGGKDDSPAGLGERRFLPICDHQLLGQTPKDYSAQSPESADLSACGATLSLSQLFPQGQVSNFPSDSLEESGTGWRWGWGPGLAGRWVHGEGCESDSLWMVKTLGKAPAWPAAQSS